MANPPVPLTLKQLAELHGVSKQVVKRAVWKERIPAFRLGTDYRIPYEVAHSQEVGLLLRRSASYAGTLAYQNVYFIGAEGGPIKIGRALTPQTRIKEIQTGYPYKLFLLATKRGGPGLERAYHERFSAHRLHGEWFGRCPEIEAEIIHLNDNSELPEPLGCPLPTSPAQEVR